MSNEKRWNPLHDANESVRLPMRWRKPRRVILSIDLFHEDVPFEFIDKVYAIMGLCPQHTFQVLTKRSERMAEYLRVTNRSACIADAVRVMRLRGLGSVMDDPCELMKIGGYNLREWPLPNVWLGTSVEDQKAADERIPHLLRCPAAVRFLSCEPLLGEVDVSAFVGTRLHPQDIEGGWKCADRWVIVGGESGPGARPCRVEHIYSIVRQGKGSGTPVFVKQLGARPVQVNHGPEMPMRWVPDDGGEAIERWYKPRDRKGADPAEWPEDLRVREMPGVSR